MRTHARHRPLLTAAVVMLLLVAPWAPGGCGVDLSLSCGKDDAKDAGSDSGKDLERLETYTNPAYGYSFKYPGDWELREADSTEVAAGAVSVSDVSAYDPDGAVDSLGGLVDVLQVSVYELTVVLEDDDLPGIKPLLEGLMEDFARQSTGFETLEALSETKTGGLSGYKVKCGFIMGDTRVTSTLYFIFDGDVEYQLLTQAAEENWGANRQVFDAFVSSFTPGTAE